METPGLSAVLGSACLSSLVRECSQRLLQVKSQRTSHQQCSCIQKMWLGGQTESSKCRQGQRCIRCTNFTKSLGGAKAVAHTIATNLPNAKVRNLGDACVCTPDWILDSIAMGKRLPVEDYLLYSRRECLKKWLPQLPHRL